jgi:tRNA U34 5-methylaminomethyl-2-thiouridine-forming methyltransferase MnmC
MDYFIQSQEINSCFMILLNFLILCFKSTNYLLNLKREIRITEDGSTTLHVPEMRENYHSIHGAIQESMHVFIQSGLYQFRDKKEIHILEMGFGTGLNCLITHMYSGSSKIHYLALEKYPVENELVEQLNFSGVIDNKETGRSFFEAIHSNPWNNEIVEICDGFYLQKFKGDVMDFNTSQKFDIIYFDAFAPQFQPELWSRQVFQQMFNRLRDNGILVTYCAKGEVRRNMIACGFEVERIPGPPGKREMLRAKKSPPA